MLRVHRDQGLLYFTVKNPEPMFSVQSWRVQNQDESLFYICIYQYIYIVYILILNFIIIILLYISTAQAYDLLK